MSDFVNAIKKSLATLDLIPSEITKLLKRYRDHQQLEHSSIHASINYYQLRQELEKIIKDPTYPKEITSKISAVLKTFHPSVDKELLNHDMRNSIVLNVKNTPPSTITPPPPPPSTPPPVPPRRSLNHGQRLMEELRKNSMFRSSKAKLKARRLGGKYGVKDTKHQPKSEKENQATRPSIIVKGTFLGNPLGRKKTKLQPTAFELEQFLESLYRDLKKQLIVKSRVESEILAEVKTMMANKQSKAMLANESDVNVAKTKLIKILQGLYFWSFIVQDSHKKLSQQLNNFIQQQVSLFASLMRATIKDQWYELQYQEKADSAQVLSHLFHQVQMPGDLPVEKYLDMLLQRYWHDNDYNRALRNHGTSESIAKLLWSTLPYLFDRYKHKGLHKVDKDHRRMRDRIIEVEQARLCIETNANADKILGYWLVLKLMESFRRTIDNSWRSTQLTKTLPACYDVLACCIQGNDIFEGDIFKEDNLGEQEDDNTLAGVLNNYLVKLGKLYPQKYGCVIGKKTLKEYLNEKRQELTQAVAVKDKRAMDFIEKVVGDIKAFRGQHVVVDDRVMKQVRLEQQAIALKLYRDIEKTCDTAKSMTVMKRMTLLNDLLVQAIFTNNELYQKKPVKKDINQDEFHRQLQDLLNESKSIITRQALPMSFTYSPTKSAVVDVKEEGKVRTEHKMRR